METNQERKLTPKGMQTRERLLETALRLFVENGYEATTMRDIAAATDSSLGLTYRYFARKEDMVMALYMRLTDDLENDVRKLPPSPLAVRFYETMKLKIVRLEPYRGALSSIFSSLMRPQSDIAILGENTAGIRVQAGNIFTALVAGSSDVPRGVQAENLSILLYATHLLVLLFWINDRSPDSQGTYALLALIRDALKVIRPALLLPPVGNILSRLAQIIKPVFGGEGDLQDSSRLQKR